MKTLQLARMATAEGISRSDICAALGLPVPRTQLNITRNAYYQESDPAKRRELLALWIPLCETIPDVREAYERAADDPALRMNAFTVWRTLTARTLARSTTATQAREAFFAAPPGCRERSRALRAWIKHCTTIDAIRDAHRHAMPDTKGAALAMTIWRKLSAQEIMTADALEAVRAALWNAPPGSAEAARALRKWRRFSAHEVLSATTSVEAHAAFSRAPGESFEQRNALATWRRLSHAQIAAANTPEAIRVALDDAPRGYPEWAFALRKLAAFYLF